jgi:hypothetical protein
MGPFFLPLWRKYPQGRPPAQLFPGAGWQQQRRGSRQCGSLCGACSWRALSPRAHCCCRRTTAPEASEPVRGGRGQLPPQELARDLGGADPRTIRGAAHRRVWAAAARLARRRGAGLLQPGLEVLQAHAMAGRTVGRALGRGEAATVADPRPSPYGCEVASADVHRSAALDVTASWLATGPPPATSPPGALLPARGTTREPAAPGSAAVLRHVRRRERIGPISATELSQHGGRQSHLLNGHARRRGVTRLSGR